MNILETESSNTNSFPKTWAFQTQTWQHCSTVFVLEFIKCSIPKLDVHYVDLSMTKTIPQITVFMGGTKKKHPEIVGLWHWVSHITPKISQSII
jgi:hypothetical protein